MQVENQTQTDVSYLYMHAPGFVLSSSDNRIRIPVDYIGVYQSKVLLPKYDRLFGLVVRHRNDSRSLHKTEFWHRNDISQAKIHGHIFGEQMRLDSPLCITKSVSFDQLKFLARKFRNLH